MKDKTEDLQAFELKYEQLNAKLEDSKQKLRIQEISIEEKEVTLNELSTNNELYESRLTRASKLTEGLKSEKLTWVGNSKEWEVKRKCTAGDILLCGAIDALLCEFNSAYREKEIESWKKILKKNFLEFSPTVSIRTILGDASDIQS